MTSAPTLADMRAAAPGAAWFTDDPDRNWHLWARLALRIHGELCAYCWCKPTTRRLTVNPITMRRSYIGICRRRRCHSKLRKWEQMGEARARRAQYDWERQHPDQVEYKLTPQMPAQYPSISRAVLRAFMASADEVATITEATTSVGAINGSIKRLGFEGEVFAEIRSGQVVLRKTAPTMPQSATRQNGGRRAVSRGGEV